MNAARPHILHLIDSLSPGGAERMAIEIANATDKNLFKVSICVTRSDLSLATTVSNDVKVFCLCRKKALDRAKLRQFRDYCVHQQVDIIHVHGRSSFALLTFLCIFYPPMRQMGVLLHDHYGDVETDVGLSAKYKIGLRYLKPVYVGVHTLLAQAALQAGLEPSHVYTIRNAVNIQPYVQHEQQISRYTAIWGDRVGPYGIVVANVRPSKDILLLLNALEHLKSELWCIAIAGGLMDTAYAEACFRLRDQLGLHDRILFLGSRLDIIELLAVADFAVLASKTESGPLALIEYLASGLPFVSTRVGSIGNYLFDQGLPEFVPPGDVEAMSKALQRLIGLSPLDRQQRGELGREIAVREFDIRCVLPDWYKAYDTVLAKNNAHL